MRTRTFGLVLASWLLASGPYAQAQFKPEDIAQREQWEEFLITADIVKSEPIGEGVTKPMKLYLKKGDIETKAAWKNPEWKRQRDQRQLESRDRRLRLDKLIGLNMVPPAVEREFKGKAGCLSLWAESKTNLPQIHGERDKPSPRRRSRRPTG